MQEVWVARAVALRVLILLLAVTYLLSDTVSVKRHVRVDGPPRVIFPWLNEATNWPRWFPWGGPGGRLFFGDSEFPSTRCCKARFLAN
jgi:hypothetical protein